MDKLEYKVEQQKLALQKRARSVDISLDVLRSVANSDILSGTLVAYVTAILSLLIGGIILGKEGETVNFKDIFNLPIGGVPGSESGAEEGVKVYETLPSGIQVALPQLAFPFNFGFDLGAKLGAWLRGKR